MKENKKSKKRKILQVFLLMICSIILYVSYATYDIWSYRFKTDDGVKTDAGIVLGALHGTENHLLYLKKELIMQFPYIRTVILKRLFSQVVQSLRQSLRKRVLLECMH